MKYRLGDICQIVSGSTPKTGLTPFPAGTVILSSRAPIGKVAIAGCEMFCNQGFKNLICSEKIDNRYLYWFLKGLVEQTELFQMGDVRDVKTESDTGRYLYQGSQQADLACFQAWPGVSDWRG